MHIGFAGPVSLELLDYDWAQYRPVPSGYPFPMTAFYVNGLIKKGHKVTVFTTSEGIEYPITLKSENLIICIARKGAHAARDFFKSERKDLVELINQNPVEVLNAHWTYEFSLAALETNLPVVITVHDYALKILYLKLREKPGINELMHWFVRFVMNFRTLKKGKHFVAVSEYLYSKLPQRIKSNSVIINDFFDEKSELLRTNCQKKNNYIVSVCNGFGYTKNIKNAITAFNIFRKRNNEFRYHLIGSGMEPDGIAYKYAEQNGLLEGIDFIGPLPYDQVVKEISGSLINLHTSREESFGMSILESQVLGTVVIGGRKSGNVPTLLENGKAGVLCNVEDPKDIASKIELCIKDKKLRDNLEQYAKARAFRNYSSSTTIDKYIVHFHTILKQYETIV